MKKVLSAVMCLCLVLSLFAGCGKSNDTPDTETQTVSVTETSQINDEMFTARDLNSDYDENAKAEIKLNGTSATSDSDSVKISGSTVTVTEEATYVISGSLTDGMIVVDAPETAKIQLVLNGAEITSSTSASLYIKTADKVFVTLNGENSLANGGEFKTVDENSIDGAVFSKDDLTFNGSGSLSITSPAGHGIVCKDDLVFTGGTYTITSSFHAIDANDSVRIKDALITADAGEDGIHAENTDDTSRGFVYIESGTLKIESEGDGISAGSYMQIINGSIDIFAGGGYENGTKKASDNWGGFGGRTNGGGAGRGSRPGVEPLAVTAETDSTSMKGLKSAGNFVINGGTFNINSADDSIHSNSNVTLNGGAFEIASGDDGLHADKTLTVTAGNINISNSYEGLEGLTILIKGGEIKLTATDDGINAAGGTDKSGIGGRDNMFGGPMNSNSNGKIVISGGTLYVKANGDGIDANGTLEITGGHITVAGPTQGDTATLDYDVSGIISGGTFIGTGAKNMAQSLSGSNQGVIAVSAGNQSAGTKITLKDEKGNEIISYFPELSFQVIILSSPDIKSGESYTLTVGTQSQKYTAR